MTTTENQSDAQNVGPAREAHNGSGATHEHTPRGYGKELLAEDERQFVDDLDALGCAVWVSGPRDDGKGEFCRPKGWQNVNSLWNSARVEPFSLGDCLCANTGGPLVVVDVDPRNGGDITAALQWLDDLGVRIYAEVATPSGGRHFYVSGGHRDIPTVHGKLPGLPGVDLQCTGANVFIPGTRRPKYDGKGYEILTNDLTALRDELRQAYGPDGQDDPDVGGAKALAQWVAENLPRSSVSVTPGQPWDGSPPDRRQQAYLSKVLAEVSKAVAEAAPGTRNDALNAAAFTLGQFVAGAGLDLQRAEDALLSAAIDCRLADDDGMESVQATLTSGMTSGMDNPRSVPERTGPDPRDPFGVKAERSAVATSTTPEFDDRAADDAFWEQREILVHIRQFSRARLAAPYAVLGAVLRRAITLIEPDVQLPPIVGTAVSLNLFTVAVGRSGQGKDAANGVARDAVRFVTPDGEAYSDPASVGIGSGEGLARIFKGFGAEDSPPPHVNLEVPEIGTLGALAVRQGSTLVGELLKAYMGQHLGFTNAQRATTTFVGAHTYRLCLGIGAQPENGAVFLDREKDGFPQRFLWLPTADPFGPTSTEDEPDEPTATDVVVPTFPTIIAGTPYMVGVPASVREQVRQLRRLTNRGSTDVDPLDGHLSLTRLKVSFGLALLDGRRDITEDDWRVAGQLVEVSNRSRADMRAVLADSRTRANTSRAHEQADRQKIIDQRLADERQKRVWKAITRKLERVETATRRELQRACDSSIASDFPSVFSMAVDLGQLVTIGGDGDSAAYRLGS